MTLLNDKQVWLVVVGEKGPGTTLSLYVRKSLKVAQEMAIELFESGDVMDEIYVRGPVDNLKSDLMGSYMRDILVTLPLVVKWKALEIENKRARKTLTKLAKAERKAKEAGQPARPTWMEH